MSTLLFGQLSDGIVPADENVVRTTVDLVTPDAPPAEAQGSPEWNELETDHNPLLGMKGRQVASDWHDPEPVNPWWNTDVNRNGEHNAVIDRQVSTSGTAAAREAAGEFGHGTMAYAVGIEPTIREGQAFGNDYFAADRSDGINPASDAVNGVQPNIVNRDDLSALAAYGSAEARKAASAGSYTAWYSQMLGK